MDNLNLLRKIAILSEKKKYEGYDIEEFVTEVFEEHLLPHEQEFVFGGPVGHVYTYQGEDAGDPCNGRTVKVITKLSQKEAEDLGYPSDSKEKGYTYYIVKDTEDGTLMDVNNFNLTV